MGIHIYTCTYTYIHVHVHTYMYIHIPQGLAPGRALGPGPLPGPNMFRCIYSGTEHVHSRAACLSEAYTVTKDTISDAIAAAAK